MGFSSCISRCFGGGADAREAAIQLPVRPVVHVVPVPDPQAVAFGDLYSAPIYPVPLHTAPGPVQPMRAPVYPNPGPTPYAAAQTPVGYMLENAQTPYEPPVPAAGVLQHTQTKIPDPRMLKRFAGNRRYTQRLRDGDPGISGLTPTPTPFVAI